MAQTTNLAHGHQSAKAYTVVPGNHSGGVYRGGHEFPAAQECTVGILKLDDGNMEG